MKGKNINMGFSEDDRIRSKNRKYNFPTPDINYAARVCIEDLVNSGFTKQSLLDELKRRILNNDDKHTSDTLTTAAMIVEKEFL